MIEVELTKIQHTKGKVEIQGVIDKDGDSVKQAKGLEIGTYWLLDKSEVVLAPYEPCRNN